MRRLILAAMLVASAGTGAVHAQGYPARTVTVIVPIAAGGAVDTTARIFAEQLQAKLGQPFGLHQGRRPLLPDSVGRQVEHGQPCHLGRLDQPGDSLGAQVVLAQVQRVQLPQERRPQHGRAESRVNTTSYGPSAAPVPV